MISKCWHAAERRILAPAGKRDLQSGESVICDKGSRMRFTVRAAGSCWRNVGFAQIEKFYEEFAEIARAVFLHFESNGAAARAGAA